jgi:hypothetical protein
MTRFFKTLCAMLYALCVNLMIRLTPDVINHAPPGQTGGFQNV